MCTCCCRRFAKSDASDSETDGAESDKDIRQLQHARSNLSDDNDNDIHIDEDDWKKALETEGIEANEKRLWVEQSAFEMVIGLIILLNVIVIGLEIDFKDSTDESLWWIIENIFCVTWLIELAVKLCALKYAYFKDCLNYVDMGLVVFDAWIKPFINIESNLILFRLLRLVRLLRLLKLLQVLRRFRNLWLLVQGFAESVSTLQWVFLMLCLIMYTFAVCLRLAVDCRGHFAEWADCDQFFGTIPKTMYTLVQVVTLESWNMTVGRPLVERQPLLFVLLLLYIFLTTFGLLNIIVGVIVENTLNIAQSDQDLQDRRMQRQILGELEFLKSVFESADSDGSGTLDRDEFVEICQRPEVKTALLRMEVPAEQPEELFDILDEEGSGQINFLTFTESVKKVRGVPSNFDMKNMMVSVSDMLRRQGRLQKQHDRTKQIILAVFGRSAGNTQHASGLRSMGSMGSMGSMDSSTGAVGPDLEAAATIARLQLAVRSNSHDSEERKVQASFSIESFEERQVGESLQVEEIPSPLTPQVGESLEVEEIPSPLTPQVGESLEVEEIPLPLTPQAFAETEPEAPAAMAAFEERAEERQTEESLLEVEELPSPLLPAKAAFAETEQTETKAFAETEKAEEGSLEVEEIPLPLPQGAMATVGGSGGHQSGAGGRRRSAVRSATSIS
ncbi:unnamed protein product [Effrenium voratum]|nr:unnamed protein product [Effrenium voratum]